MIIIKKKYKNCEFVVDILDETDLFSIHSQIQNEIKQLNYIEKHSAVGLLEISWLTV